MYIHAGMNNNNNNDNLYCQKIKLQIFCYILDAYTLNKNLP